MLGINNSVFASVSFSYFACLYTHTVSTRTKLMSKEMTRWGTASLRHSLDRSQLRELETVRSHFAVLAHKVSMENGPMLLFSLNK